ncbi:tetratricopeptide repeat protein [Chloroflexota bacterium]
MDKDDLRVYDEHNNNPAAEVPLQQPPEDVLERTPAVEQMPGAEPLLDRAASPEIPQENLRAGAPLEELAPVRTAEQAEGVMKAREAHIEETAPVVEEAAQASSQAPWWKQIFAGWSRGEEAAETLPEEGQKEALKEGLPSEGALPAVPADQLPPAAAAPVPWWRWLLTWLTWEAGPDGVTPDEEAAPLTADDGRALVQEELACLREDMALMVHHELERAEEQMDHRVQAQVPDLVQAELAREHGDHCRAAQRALREVGDEMAACNLQWLQAQQDLLNQEVLLALQDPDLPLRERLELINLVGDRPAQVVGQMAELEAAVAKRVAEADQALAELDGRGSVAELQAEVARQSEVMAKLEAQGRRSAWRSWGLVSALLLVAVVGVAGILLPRRTGPEPRLLIEMASLQQTAGKNEEAVRLLDEAVEAGIGDAETLGHVGEMYRALTEYEKAVEVLEQAVERDPVNEDHLLNLARSYGSAGQHEEAIAQYQALIKINPTNVWYYGEAGNRYRSLGNYEQALVGYQKMLEINPNLWTAYYLLGEVYRRNLEQYDLAIDHYRRAVAIKADDYWLRLNYGRSYASKNDHTHAAKQFQAAIEIDPDQPEAYYYLGKAYLAQGHFEQAVEIYQQAIERNEGYTMAHVDLGKAYVALDDCASAIVQFTEALRHDPDNAEAEEGLAVCGHEGE